MMQWLMSMLWVVLLFLLAHESRGIEDSWLVLVDSSRYFFNYRHLSNALAMYSTAKQLGMPDERILLLTAENVACNPRNPKLPLVYSSSAHSAPNLLSNCPEIDYKGTDVSAESFFRLLTGRTPASFPASKQLRSGPESNVLIYITGHGGKEFFKFQDQSELSAKDITNAIEQMHASGRYKQLMLAVDTCQAASLGNHITSPDVAFVASSDIGENSYSFANDQSIGVSLIDRFTSIFSDLILHTHSPQLHMSNASLHSTNPEEGESMLDFLPKLTPYRLRSNVTVDRTLPERGIPDPLRLPIYRYFGSGQPHLRTMPQLYARR
jgi:phosphatidylinositol glycan class K